MNRYYLIIFALTVTTSSHAQFGVSYHLNNAYVGLNYQINDRFLPEARFSTFNTFEDIDWEVNLSYIYFKNQVVDAYAGAGVTYFDDGFEFISHIVVPIDLNIYIFILFFPDNIK